MVATRTIVGIGVAAALAVVAGVAPAIGADEGRLTARAAPAGVGGGLGGFTPSAGDPKLAAALARAGLSASGFRFTPSGATEKASRAVTVAVRARSNRTPAALGERVAAPSPVALAPIAYNLGVAVGWKRFALSSELTKVDLAGQPGSRESADLGISYTGRSFGARVKAEAVRPLANQPRLLAETPSYSLEAGGAYKITRNLDVTAGVRYRSDRERLPQLTDDRRDSQSVYVGTAFRF
ncbi:hypothetical protein SAMN06297144_1050 [Sphingomonas guangdongensis]|uniref:Porin n=1 Tax=Sphingomonas guangdongensis TaxID=1141890 RepID=A0A285QEL7_9SPHN|nr:hypothetical protein [Sphingomonas guangdongensis]SOB80415.1 hypothetical protein SAMN06297144_1050 [Sphingomonas guangdongensis]